MTYYGLLFQNSRIRYTARKTIIFHVGQTEMEDRRATVTDAVQSTTFRLHSSAAAHLVTGAAYAVPRHKVQ